MADADEPNADAGALQEEAQKSRDALMGLLLPFQQALVSELLQEDGLAILAPGLGLHQVVAVLLRLQNARLREPGQRGVVLVLGAAAWQRDTLRRELARIDPLAAQAGAATEGEPAADYRLAGMLIDSAAASNCTVAPAIYSHIWRYQPQCRRRRRRSGRGEQRGAGCRARGTVPLARGAVCDHAHPGGGPAQRAPQRAGCGGAGGAQRPEVRGSRGGWRQRWAAVHASSGKRAGPYPRAKGLHPATPLLNCWCGVPPLYPASRVTDTSGEGFATRLFKGGHPQGFVRAFSDLPSAFTAEFNKARRSAGPPLQPDCLF